MNRVLTGAVAFALALLTAVANAQTKTASEMYWDAVRASTGPIGFPRGAPDDGSTRPFHPRRAFGPGVFAPTPFVVPEPVYVPVYVPGPVIYLPVPGSPASLTTLAPEPAYSATPPAPRKPERFYVIPGCYGGNKPPTAESLPAGCDIKKLRISTW